MHSTVQVSEMLDAMSIQEESDHFSPYRSDGKLYGFVCVVTGANMPVGGAIVTELAGAWKSLDGAGT
jgi:hypothetical protein